MVGLGPGFGIRVRDRARFRASVRSSIRVRIKVLHFKNRKILRPSLMDSSMPRHMAHWTDPTFRDTRVGHAGLGSGECGGLSFGFGVE